MSDEHVQILLYTSYLHIIGGIETFVINFLDLMKEEHEIAVYCPRLPDEMAERVSKRVKLIKHGPVSCDTLVMVRMMDNKPRDIICSKSVRMSHACKSNPSWKILPDCDRVVCVSKASKQSFNIKADVIYNPLLKTDKKAIFLVSATRIPALDKGKNAERMLTLARMLNDADIPFLWFNFSDAPLQNAPKGFLNVGTFQDLQPYIAKADYLVQLSDQEGFGLSVLEALINSTAVLCTPFETTKELGVIDGVNGYIVPYDMNFDVNKLLEIPTFEYSYDNEKIKAKWNRVFNAKPKKIKKEDIVRVKVINPYKDLELNKKLSVGMIIETKRDRAEYLVSQRLVRLWGE